MTDEAHFHLNGKKCRIWASEIAREIHGITSARIIAHISFKMLMARLPRQQL